MKTYRGLRVALVVLIILGVLLMAAKPSHAWRGWWWWPAGVGVGLAVTSPYWAGYPCYAPYAPAYGYYRYYGYPDPYYSDRYYHERHYNDRYYHERVYYYPY